MKGRTHKLIVLGVVGLMVVTLLVGGIPGCAKPAPPTPPPAPGPLPPVVTEWNIPFIAPLTGPAAVWGMEAAWAAEAAVDHINETGGIRGVPIKLTKYDASFDPARAIVVMTEVLGTKPLVIEGPMMQETTVPTGDLAVKEGVPFIGSLASPELRQQFEPWGCSLYQDFISACAQAATEWLRLNPDIKSVVLFYSPEMTAHVSEVEALEEEFKVLGIQILGEIEVPMSQIDMSPLAVKAIGLKPDGYFSVLDADKEAKLSRELYERGVTEGRRIHHGYASNSAPLYEQGKGFLEDTYIFEWYRVDYEGEEWQALVEAYKAEHSGALPYASLVPCHYNTIYAIKAAFEALEITGDPAKLSEERIKIRDFLWNAKDIPGVQGEWSYVKGKKLGPIYTFQIRNNKPEIVSTLPAE
jgi:branched-chain amino acid transport system substrate-binding protein